MIVTIQITKEDNFDVIERRYKGDFDKLYNEDWQAKLEDMLSVLDAE